MRERIEIGLTLDPAYPTSTAQTAVELQVSIRALSDKLDEPNRRYQGYELALKAWQKQRSAIVGDSETPDTAEYFEATLRELDEIPDKLKQECEQRLSKVSEIHEVIRELAETYGELYAPVNKFIATRELVREKFQLNFEVSIVDRGFADKFLTDFISQSGAGTFYGKEAGTKALKGMLSRHDFNTEQGTTAFVSEIMAGLQSDQRAENKPVPIAGQLRKGKTVLELYNLIFSLDYIAPKVCATYG